MALAIKDGAGATQQTPLYDAAYSAGGVTFTPVAAPTMWLLMVGAASTYIRLKHLRIAGFATTAGTLIMELVKGSDTGTAGSGVLTGVTAVPHNSGSAAAAAVISTVGTANYTTVPTAVGSMIRSGRVYLEIVTVGQGGQLIWDFTVRGDQAPILLSASQCLYVTSAAGTLPAGTKLDWEIQWEESTAA